MEGDYMYYGKMTKELEQLYKAYEKMWGNEPDFYENTEYGDEDYDDYVADIKKSLELKTELPNLYSHDDEF